MYPMISNKQQFFCILKSKWVVYTSLIVAGSLLSSCQSDTEMANDVLNTAIQMENARQEGLLNNEPATDSVKLPIQHSTFTDPVKKAPSQEELIIAHKVKTVKQTYEGGWSIATYDKKGNKVSEESDYSGKTTYTYEFDKNNRVTKEKTKYKDGMTFMLTYKYNDEGKLITKTFTDSEGKPSVTMMEYNPKLDTRTETSSTGVDKEFYDNRGLRVRFESYDENHKLMGAGEAKYNKEGLKVNEVASIMGMSTNDEFEYNERGQLLKQHRTGILDVYFIFEYNEKGLITNHKNIKNQREEETVYTYTYY